MRGERDRTERSLVEANAREPGGKNNPRFVSRRAIERGPFV